MSERETHELLMIELFNLKEMLGNETDHLYTRLNIYI